MNELIADKIKILAYLKHKGQFRKGKLRIPYINHPKAVVDQLKEWGIDDDETLAIAWGHDLLEDTDTTEDDILFVSDFNRNVLDGIKQLTFDNNTQTKDEYLLNIAKNAPINILTIKIADRLCNVRDFLNLDSALYHIYAVDYYAKGLVLIDQYKRLPPELGDKVLKTNSEVGNMF